MNITSTIEKVRPVANRFFQKTMAVLDKTWRQIKFVWTAWTISSIACKLLYIAYLIYALAFKLGNIYANIGFLVFSVAYFVFDQITKSYTNPEAKKQISKSKKGFRYAKIVMDIIKLSMAVYGVYISWNNPSVVAVILAVVSFLVFLFDVLFEILYTIIMSRYKALCIAFNQDISVLNIVKNTASAVGNLIVKRDISEAISSGVDIIATIATKNNDNDDSKLTSKIGKIFAKFKKDDHNNA